MCGLSEDTLGWEVLNEYPLVRSETRLDQLVLQIAAEKNAAPADVEAILISYYGADGWKED